MTSERVAEIRKRLQAANAGPWLTKATPKDEDGWPTCELIAATYKGQNIYATVPGGVYPAANQDFIAHAWEDIRDLLEYVDSRMDNDLAAYADLDEQGGLGSP